MRDEKEALALLRQERKESVDRAKEMVKEQKALFSALKNHLQKEDATVPELALALGVESSRVLLFISGLRKYGEVVEGAKNDGYFEYHLVEKNGETP